MGRAVTLPCAHGVRVRPSSTGMVTHQPRAALCMGQQSCFSMMWGKRSLKSVTQAFPLSHLPWAGSQVKVLLVRSVQTTGITHFLCDFGQSIHLAASASLLSKSRQ